ncbi:MAG: MFS transporter [Desulfosporosinus sp.]|nr:MFS transporter [Desulfosporosinus sp.]
MAGAIEERLYAYRWTILLIIFLVNTIFNFSIFQIGGLASRIIPAFHLQGSQLAMVLSVSFLTNAIIGIPAGILADRFGVKNVVATGLVLTVISSFGRLTANSFGILFIWMFILGVGPAFLNANAAKILGDWFPPQQMGMAMGIYIAGANTGITIALATSAFFSSLKVAFMTSAVMTLLALFLWLLFIKPKSAGKPEVPIQPLGEYLGVALKSKYIWVGAIAMFFYMGTYVTQSGFLSNALTQGKGITQVMAGLVASSLTISFIIGTIIGPIISDKVGLIKPFLIPTAIIAAICSYLAWIIPFGTLTWILLIIAGVMLGTSVPLIMSLPMMLPDIGPAYAGSAGGVISTLQMAGAFVISSYVILPLAGKNMDQVFMYIGLGYLVFGLILILLPELGRKAKKVNLKIPR